MKITKTQIYNLDPCQEGIERLNKQLRGFPQDKSFDVADLIGGVNTWADIVWLLQEMGYEDQAKSHNHYRNSLLNRDDSKFMNINTFDAKLNAKLKELIAAI